MFSFLIFVMVVGYVFSAALGNSWILYIAVGFSIVSAFVSYWWSDKIVLKMSDAHEVKFEDNKELYRIVENLCITAGLPTPKIYIINDTAPNAFATGRDPDHAVVAVTRGLLEKLDRSELEGVIAHELSHIGNRDILIGTIATVLVGFVVLLADWFRHWAFFSGFGGGNREGGQLRLILIIAAVILSILAPIFAYILQFTISRKQEFKADADGALLTRYPDGLASALEKISSDNEKLEAANRATAHMYISSPFKKDRKKKKSFWAKAFMTHPPVEERVAALRGMRGAEN
jgi:heat shock protein HtpX